MYRYFCHYFWLTEQMCICYLLLRNKPTPGLVKTGTHVSPIISGASHLGVTRLAGSRGSHEAASEGLTGAERPSAWLRVSLPGGWGFGSSHAAPALAVLCPHGPAACLLEPATREGEEGSATPRGPSSAGRDSSGRGYRRGRVLRGLQDSKALRTRSRGECPVARSPSLRCFHFPMKGLGSAEGRL